MEISAYVNRGYLTSHPFPRWVVPCSALSLLSLAIVVVFAVVPGEQVMGPVQRIFYFHVGSAVTAYVMVGMLLFSSLCYLRSRREEWDLVAHGACGVAFLFASIVLATGMIWGHSAWNTWWRWEPRLVSFLILWLILLSYLVLRFQGMQLSGERTLAAVLGIVSAVNIPIVVFSVKLLETSEQLHPQVIGRYGLTDQWYGYGLFIAATGLIAFSGWLFLLLLTEGVLKCDLEKITAELNRCRRRSHEC